MGFHFRIKLEQELEEVKKLLGKNEVDLRKLQKENSKSFAVAAIIMFFSFLLYGLYLFISGWQNYIGIKKSIISLICICIMQQYLYDLPCP